MQDVENVISAIALIEKRMIVATNMYNVAQQFEVQVADEEMALYKSLFPQFRHLKVHYIQTNGLDLDLLCVVVACHLLTSVH